MTTPQCLCCRGSLAVTTDTLGRVILWDLAAVTALRMWKGYREAQCAWLMLPETHPRRPARDMRLARRASSTATPTASPTDHDASGASVVLPSMSATAAAPDEALTAAASAAAAAMASPPAAGRSPESKVRKRKVLEATSLKASAGGTKEALHLVIYAPKRGVVELWPLRQGKRLRSLTCGGSCRLLAANPPLSAEQSLQQQCAWARDCLLLDLDTGSVIAVGAAFSEQGSDERKGVQQHDGL